MCLQENSPIFIILETRIDWCRDVINGYFSHGGLQKVLDKEQRKAEHAQITKAPSADKSLEENGKEGESIEDKDSLLVGAEINQCEDVPTKKYSCSSV